MRVRRYFGVFIISFMLFLSSVIVFPICGQAAATKTTPVTRLSGLDRYQTAVEISKAGWKSSDYVVLATGDGEDKFADALAGSPLSYLLGAPTLLTTSGALNADTRDEIKRLDAKNAIILGGTGVIAPIIEAELKDMKLNSVERLWGMDRYETAVRIAERVRSLQPSSKVFVTTGEEFQYSMMIAPFASRTHAPILFSQKDTLTKITKDALTKWNIKDVEIIGNTNIISQAVEDSIKASGIKVSRIDGADITETNINIINKYGSGCPFLAAARNDLFADGLAGASLAAILNMPILLVDQIDPSAKITGFINRINYNAGYIFGGTGAVSDRVLSILEKAVPYISIYGNSTGNISTGAYTAINRGWIYYLNDKDSKKLYKIKADGTDKIKLCDDKPLDINIVGDWVYYENMNDGNKIYKIRTDGSGRVKLNDDESWDMNVVNNTIYYSVNTDGSKIYKIAVDGTGRFRLNSAASEYVNVVGDWIYYSNWDDNRKLYKIKTDGTGGAKVSDDEIWYSNAVGDFIYYSNGSDAYSLYKIKTDGSGRAKIINDNAQWLNVYGDWIYYSNGSDLNKLYKIKTDGTGKTKLFDGTACVINIAGDYIYFSNDLEGLKLYRIKTDGSGLMEVN